MNFKKLPPKARVSIVCFAVSLILIPVALATLFTIVLATSCILSGFGWGIIYALPSDSDNKSRSEQ